MKKMRILLTMLLLWAGTNVSHAVNELVWQNGVEYFVALTGTDGSFGYTANVNVVDFGIDYTFSIVDGDYLTIDSRSYKMTIQGFSYGTTISDRPSLIGITITSPNNVYSFNHANFQGCPNLKEIIFTNKVWNYGNAVFANPDNITVRANAYDEKLTTWQGHVKCATTNPDLTQNDVGYYKNSSNQVYVCQINDATSVVIPATVNSSNVTYYGAPDVDVTSPTSIKNLTFEGYITPNTSFANLTNLENITFNGVTANSLQGKLTDNANLKTITFYNSLPLLTGNATDYVAHPENVTILIGRNLGVTPAQLHYSDVWSSFKAVVYVDEWTGGSTELTISATPSNKPVELWQGSNKLGSISTNGGYFSTSLESTENLVLRVPNQYLEGIILDNYDITPLLTSTSSTDTGYENYTYYTLSSQYLQGIAPSIQIKFSDDCPQNLQTDAFRVQMSGAGTVHGVIKFADYSAYDGDRYSFDLDGGNMSVWNFVFTNPGTYGARRVREVEWLEITVTPEIDNPSAIVFEAGRSPFTTQDNGDGSYTYTITGYDLTSNWVNIDMPATDFGDVKTVISSRNGNTLGYYFGEYIIIDSWFNPDYNQSKDAFVNTDETVTHFDNWVLAEWGVLSTGIIYIQVPKAAQGEPLPFRLIENGEDKTSLCCWQNAGEYFSKLLEIDSYYRYECPVDGYYYLLQDVQNDSYIIVDDGTTPLDQVASPFQLVQSLSVHGDATLTLRKSNGQIVKSVSDGESETVSWEKGESMQISATLPENTSAANYEVHLIIDGDDNILGIVTGDGGMTSLASFEMGSINTAHNIVLITRQVGGFEAPDIIEFADTIVKSICVANWDTDGDGELSKDEAAAVTTLKKDNGDGTFGDPVFKNNTTITSFDELKYFTGLEKIDLYAFYKCSNLTSVALPPSVTTIDGWGFCNCSALKMISLPESLTTIGENAFNSSGLQVLFIPKNVSSISTGIIGGLTDNLTSVVVDKDNSNYTSLKGSNGIFKKETENRMTLVAGCQSTTIPEGVTSISTNSFFYQRNLKTITLPSTLSSIGIQTFYFCSGLESMVSLAMTPPTFGTSAFTGIKSTCVLTVPKGKRQTYIDAGWTEEIFKGGIVEEEPASEIIEFADAEVKRICVENWDDNGDGELSKTEAAAVTTLVDSETSKSVFYNNRDITSFDEFQYFTGLESLPAEAFRGCSYLESIYVPETAVTWGERTFYGSGLKKIVFPKGLKVISSQCFQLCTSLTSFVVPEGIEKIGAFAFRNCSKLKSILLPQSLKTIDAYQFDQQNQVIKTLVIPAGVTSISSFVVRRFDDLVVEASNTKYDSREGCGCIIETSTNTIKYGSNNARIPNTVTTIGQSAFYGSNITEIEIPSSVNKIEQWAFYDSSNLVSVVAKRETPPTLSDATAFGNISSECVLTVPYGTRDAYIAAGWTTDIFKGGIVEDKSKYDTNGDSSVSIADVTTLVNVILGKPIQ